MLHRWDVEPEVADDTPADLARLVDGMRDALNAIDDLALEVEALLPEQLACWRAPSPMPASPTLQTHFLR
jgi:hypothetical protein